MPRSLHLPPIQYTQSPLSPGTPSAYINTALLLPTNTKCPLKSVRTSQHGRRWGSYLRTNISSCATRHRPPFGSCKVTVHDTFLQIWYKLPSQNTRFLTLVKVEIVLYGGAKLVVASNDSLLPIDDNNDLMVAGAFRSGPVTCIWMIFLLCTTGYADVSPSRMIGSRR